MSEDHVLLSIMVVDDDKLLLADIVSASRSELSIKTVTSITLGLSLEALSGFDLVAVNLGVSGGFALVEALGARKGGPLVIAMASVGALGQSLEYTLTLAELRGAVLSLAKPLDAAELIVAAIDVVEARRETGPALDGLRRDFARRAAA